MPPTSRASTSEGPATISLAGDWRTTVGVVLAGGVSRRLGRDKATLVLAEPPPGGSGESLAERAARALAAVAGEVLVADRGRGLLAPRWPSVPDGPGAGPAAGILGAAAARPGRPLLVLACDLPAAGPELLRLLLELAAARSDAGWVVPRVGGRLEPLCALYRPPALAALDAAVRQGRYALHPLAADAGLVVAELGEACLQALDPALRPPLPPLFNLNNPGDLALAITASRLAPPRRGG